VSFQSLADAVGQDATAFCRFFPVARLSGSGPPVDARGVGQNARHPGCFVIDGLVWFAVLVGVGQPEDEDSLSSMWRADFLRCKQSERAAETASRQVLKDAIEAERHVAGDVLEEDPARSKSSDELEDDRPQMTRVVFSQSLSCLAERLAWIASGDPVHSREFMRG